jgi:hypothetical protein
LSLLWLLLLALQVVGSSPSECDTIPGRQAMASCFFLLKQYEDVLVFLSVSASFTALLPPQSATHPAWLS